MTKLITECNDLFKDCGFTYAFCGGYAFELFINKTIRPHADIDISIFEEDKKAVVTFMLSNVWNVYEHKTNSTDNKKSNSFLRSILSSDDEHLSNLHCVWAIKPDCSLFKIKAKLGIDNIFYYKILNEEQLNFDFIEIIFNKQQDGSFVCNKSKNIMREPDKAILFRNGIPYLAPELMLFIISNPVYVESEYHREKNHIDFNSTAPSLPKESKAWLINALETAYPEGNKRLEQLKNMD